ncbi:MAG: hypothetical protein M3004_07710 [Bacteroidota bacterium]|nr:hypothetical protein [Bacteroidota bacterium]
MKQYFFSLIILFFFFAINFTAISQPTVEQFKQVFNSQMQKLKTTGFTKRNISFVQVTKGTPNGGYYPFKVSAYVHDYAPGYPSNHYYGQTCVGKIDNWKFDMLKNEFGEWIVQGRMTASDADCKNNPSEGAEAIPLSSLPGIVYVQLQKTNLPVNQNQQKSVANKNAELYIGEYACYGTGNRLMAGMGFTLKSNGSYFDLDNKRGGSYSFNKQNATITFKGGFLSGQMGTGVTQRGFQLTNTVFCEPWR